MPRRSRSAPAISARRSARLAASQTVWRCESRLPTSRGTGALCSKTIVMGAAIAGAGRTRANGISGNARVSTGIARDPPNIVVHAARRIEAVFTRSTHNRGSCQDQEGGTDSPLRQKLYRGHYFFSLRDAIFSASLCNCSGSNTWLSTRPTSSSSTEPPQKRSISCCAACTATFLLLSTAR